MSRRDYDNDRSEQPERPLRAAEYVRMSTDHQKYSVNRRSIGTPYRRAKGTPLRCVDRLMLGAGFALLAA